MIIVLGDAIRDEYVELETVRKCPEGDWPIVREVNRYTQRGGALAVGSMVGEHTELAGPFCGIYSLDQATRKTRVSIDGIMVHRIDEDSRSGDVAFSGIHDEYYELPPGTIVLIADYGKGAINRSVIETCLALGWKVIVDPHPTQEPSVYHGCWAICPNRAENNQHDFLTDAAFPRVCLKLDKDGMVIKDGDITLAILSTIEQPPFDVCCAGDRVLATIGVMMNHGAEWADACIAANYAAGLQCGRRGAEPLSQSESDEVMKYCRCMN